MSYLLNGKYNELCFAKLCRNKIDGISVYLKQTGMISPLAKQYFSTNSGAILLV